MSIAQLAEIEFAAPRQLDEACELLARYERDGRTAWAIAGCTDWMVERHMAGPFEPSGAVAIDISRVPELHGISERDGLVRIGAAETFLSMRRHARLVERCPILVEMASEIGAVQIQARGTLGGNLVTASPAADGVAVLFALDARVILKSVRAERSVPVTDFYTGYRKSVRRPDEVVVRFEFAVPMVGAHQFWRKVGTRKAQSISKVAMAGLLELDSTGVVQRVGFGMASVAEVMLPLASLRSLLAGRDIREVADREVDAAVEKDIRPIDDVRSTEGYRRHVGRVLARRFVQNARNTVD